MKSPIQRFQRNERGRDLIVGDIHGHFSRLKAALDVVGFDPAAGDRLFSVGDLVDRGPESDQATTWLEQPWFHAVAGNHEDFAIRWPDGGMSIGMYVANGGAWNVANPIEERCRLADVFSALPVAIELETETGLVGVVHADCPYADWDTFRRVMHDGGREAEHAVLMAQWSRDRTDKELAHPVRGVRAVVVGHTPMRQSKTLGNVIHIDTGGWLGWGFTILDAATLKPAANITERTAA